MSAFAVEGAPGPFAAGQDIWFSFDIANRSVHTHDYDALGAWVEQTGQYQKSWTSSSLEPGQNLVWRDHINIPDPGTYDVYLAIRFSDGATVLLSGPIVLAVE